jgi:hypothetical protein
MRSTKAYYAAFALFISANAQQRDLIQVLEQVNEKTEVLTPSCLRGKSGGLSFEDMRAVFAYLKVPDVAVLDTKMVGIKLEELRLRSMLAYHLGTATPTTHLHKTLRMFCSISGCMLRSRDCGVTRCIFYAQYLPFRLTSQGVLT